MYHMRKRHISGQACCWLGNRRLVFFPCIPNVYLVAKIIYTQVFMLYRRTNLSNKIYIREHHARKNPHTA